MEISDKLCFFFEEEAFRDTDRPGFRRRVMTGDNLQLCFWRIAGGATGSFLHHHPENEQLGIVVRGKVAPGADYATGTKLTSLVLSQFLAEDASTNVNASFVRCGSSTDVTGPAMCDSGEAYVQHNTVPELTTPFSPGTLTNGDYFPWE